MNLFKAKLIGRLKRTDNVESFRLKPLEQINFIPGQFLRLIFDEGNKNNQNLNKYLSFSSSPTKEYIEVTKKLGNSIFSQRLKDLKINDEISFEAPLGNCIFKEEYKKIAFLIGGIGITPVISIIEYIADKKLDTNVVLFYSNRTEEDIAFRKELDYWHTTRKNIEIFYTVTECQPKDNLCLYGRIDHDLLKRKIDDWCERIVFIFGPPVMVDGMINITKELGCDDRSIKTEKFIGY